MQVESSLNMCEASDDDRGRGHKGAPLYTDFGVKRESSGMTCIARGRPTLEILRPT